MNNVYVHPVSSSLKKVIFPKPSLHTKELLLNVLQKKELNITLGKTLKGGTVSQVYEAELDNKKAIVKHTEDLYPFDPTEIFISKKGHNQDTKILKILSKSKNIRVPKILYFFPEITTTVMEDLREKGLSLLSDIILSKKLPLNSAEKIGRSLANLAVESRNWKIFTTNESAHQSIYERGLELRLAYPNTQEQYLYLEKEFIENKRYLMWPDGHPKNMFVNNSGEVIFIDFGRSVWADQRYMLPNFLSHIAIYSLVGYYSQREAINFIDNTIRSYKTIDNINEAIFCQYFGMEILHRATGKWLSGISKTDNKVKLFRFGLMIFDNKILSIGHLLDLFKRN